MFCFLFVVNAPSFVQSSETNDSAISVYKKNRQSFIDQQQKTDQRFNKESSALEREVQDLQEKISGKNNELGHINSLLRQKEAQIMFFGKVQNGISAFLFPVATAGTNIIGFISGGWAVTANLLCVFLAVTTINLFIYLKSRQTANSPRAWGGLLRVRRFFSLFPAPVV